MMRSGPKPLPFQLGMASLASAGLAGGTAFSESTLQDFFKGIQKYQAHPFKREMPSLPIVWEEGEGALYCATDKRPALYTVPVVLVPSMVNRSDILDLLPERSMLRWLAAQGFDTYLFDWGTTTADAAQGSFDDALQKRLIPAIESLGRPVLLMGYCMGGLFASALSSLRPDLTRGCALLATPWNFHDEGARLRARLSILRPMAIPYLKQYNRLPESWVQALFATLDPEGSIRKFAAFAAMDQDDPRGRMFVAVEDWLNEGLDLPAGIAMTCFEEWYEENLPGQGLWTVCGEPVTAGGIKVPTLVIAASDDRIVPPDSAMAFADQRVKGERLLCRTGHVGLIAGKSAIEDMWQPLAQWFALQQ